MTPVNAMAAKLSHWCRAGRGKRPSRASVSGTRTRHASTQRTRFMPNGGSASNRAFPNTKLPAQKSGARVRKRYGEPFGLLAAVLPRIALQADSALAHVPSRGPNEVPGIGAGLQPQPPFLCLTRVYAIALKDSRGGC